MKLFTGSLAAGLVLLAGGAQAQVPGPLHGGIGFRCALCGGAAPGSRAAIRPGPRYGYGPSLLPSTEVYSVLRDNGFSPLGIPRLRGFVYTIAVIDRGGEDGRLIIDARNGRIIRFMPAYRMGDNYYEEPERPRRTLRRRSRRRPKRRTMSRPRRGRHGRPMSRAARCRCRRPARSPPSLRPAPVQQAAAPAPKPAEVQAAAPVTTGSAPAKPAPQIAPTQDMPTAQGLE